MNDKTPELWTVKALQARFLELEKQHDLFALRVDDYPVWEVVRYRVYNEILGDLGLRPRQSVAARKSLRDVLGAFAWLPVGLITRNPFVQAEKTDVAIFGHPRRKWLNDTYKDIYTDDLIETLAPHYHVTALENPVNEQGHLRPACNPDLLYLDLIYYLSAFVRRLPFIRYSPEAEKKVDQLGDVLFATFSSRGRVDKQIVQALRRRAVELPLYLRLLKKLKPALILLVSNMDRQSLIEAGKQLGIPVAELQHGSPAPGKLNYDYRAASAPLRLFPDYFIAFGPFWTRQNILPLNDDHILYLGYLFFEKQIQKYAAVPKERQVVFLSQPPIGRQLARLALGLGDRVAPDVKILFKYHPSEVLKNPNPYPELVDHPRIQCFTDDDEPLYETLARSRWQVGCNSTALYEGLAFGCTTFIADVPGAEQMTDLIASGAAELVKSAEDIKLDDTRESVDWRPFFETVGAEKIRETVQRLMKRP